MSCRDIIFFFCFFFLHPRAHFCRSHLPLLSSCLFYLLFSSHFIYLFYISFLLLLLLLCFSHCRVVLIPSLCWGMFHKIYICRYARGLWTFLLQDNLHIFLVKIPAEEAEMSYECRSHIQPCLHLLLVWKLMLIFSPLSLSQSQTPPMQTQV